MKLSISHPRQMWKILKIHGRMQITCETWLLLSVITISRDNSSYQIAGIGLVSFQYLQSKNIQTHNILVHHFKKYAERKNGFIQMFELRQEYDNIDLEASGSIEMDSESFKDLLLIQKGLETLIKHDKISKNHQKGRNQNYEEHLGKIEEKVETPQIDEEMAVVEEEVEEEEIFESEEEEEEEEVVVVEVQGVPKKKLALGI